MAEAAIIFFLRKLGYQLIQEGNLLSGVHDDIEWIKKELQTMVAFLKDIDRRQQRDERVAAWIAEVRELIYDAEDIIDEYVTKMGTLSWKSLSFLKYFHVRYQVGRQIMKIKKEVIEVKERRDRYGFQVVLEDVPASSHRGPGGASSRGIGAATPFIREDEIVGIDDDVEQLLNMLLEGNQQQRLVISVFGMGGLGKTTLVKEVFKIAKSDFDCYSWVSVSQISDSGDVLKNILFKFKASRGEPAIDAMDMMDEGQLQESTYEYLQDKKYLLVLDDVWDDQLWQMLKQVFPRNNGRIIFTTRIRDIASSDEDNFHIYDLQPLPFELAWSIFCKKTFRTKGTCPEDLKEYAEAMVRRCGGLPLAIVAIAGLLSSKGENQPAWQSVIRTLDWELSHHRGLERLNRSLLFGYIHLPFYLKYCFLYIGLFPEDYEIARKRLIRMWIAEGFVEDTPNKTQEEVANHYFLQLTDRSMIQAVTLHARDVMKACKVHDLMRDIANYMLKEEKFGAIQDQGNTIIQERQRRLSIYDDVEDIHSCLGKLKLRSLLMFRINEISLAVLQKMLKQLKLARVLDFRGTLLENLPDGIGELIHLRYLDLRGTLVNILPNSIKNLKNLQTLDVRDTNVAHLPTGINNLQQLRHLLLSSFRKREKGFVKFPKGKKSFLDLQTLSGVECDEDFVQEVGSLTNLRKLYVGRLKEADSSNFCNSLKRLSNLRSLTIISDSPLEQGIQMEPQSWSPRFLEKLKVQVHMTRLPKWFNSLECLHTLYLFKNFLRQDPFPVLERLPRLVILTLASSAFSSKEIKCSVGGFPKLKLLRILGMENWITWWPIEKGTMPSLQYLLIADCPRLIQLPDGFHHLTTLQDLTFSGLSANFSNKLQKYDRWKVSHVREVSIISQVNGKFVKERFQ